MDVQDEEKEVQKTVTKIFEAIRVDRARSIGNDWKGRKLILVMMKDMGGKDHGNEKQRQVRRRGLLY